MNRLAIPNDRFVICSTSLHLYALVALVGTAMVATSSAQQLVDPLPLPVDVSGKTISDWLITGDQDSVGAPNPHLTRNWDGTGNTTDSLDYTNSLASFQIPGATLLDVDALGNIQDLHFKRLVNDEATLLVSPTEPQNAVGGGFNEIYSRTATPFGALAAVWAKNANDIGGANSPPGTDTPPEGIDGLEVWGTPSDHNMFSLYDDPPDPNDPNLAKVSVFIYDVNNDDSTPYIYNDQLRTAIGLVPGEPEIDLDGMMVFDDQADGVFGPGDSLLFTVEENPMFHGGEIWVWDFGSPANFLLHGGILWDSINQPAGIFGWGSPTGGVPNDINALEAIFVVPEPSSTIILLLSCVLCCGQRTISRS